MPMPKLARSWIGLLFVFAVLMGCSPSFTTDEPPVAATNARAPLDDNLTAGASVRSTREAKATLDAQATLIRAATQLRETQQAATATIVARATGQAVLAAKSAWPSRLRETFKDNSLAWPLGMTQDHSLAVNSSMAAGLYRWTVNVSRGYSYFNLMPEKGPTLSDFYAEVTVRFAPTNADNASAYGLAFRHVKNDYGFFGISASGEFRMLEVHHTGIYQMWLSNSSAIDQTPGAANRIAVAAVGSDFVFLINDQVVGQLNADIDPGQVGLGVDALTNSDEGQVEFSDFEIHAP